LHDFLHGRGPGGRLFGNGGRLLGAGGVLLDHPVDLVNGAIDLFKSLGLLTGGSRCPVDNGNEIIGIVAVFVKFGRAGLYQFASLGNGAGGSLNERGCIFCRLGRLYCEVSDLAGNDGEAGTYFTRTGSLPLSLAQTWPHVSIARDRFFCNKPKSSLQNGVSRARAGLIAVTLTMDLPVLNATTVVTNTF